MKAVIGARIHIGLIDGVLRLERGLIRGPAGIDALVLRGVMQQQGRADAGDLGIGGLTAIERHRRCKLGIRHRRRISHAAAIAEAGDADLAGGAFAAHQKFHCGEEVVHQLGRVDLRLQRAPLFVVAGYPPTELRPSGANATKPALATRRATSSIYGFKPRFSCATTTPGTAPVTLAGRTR